MCSPKRSRPAKRRRARRRSNGYDGTNTSIVGLNSVKLDKYTVSRELHAGRRRRLLRLRSDQEKGRHRLEFPRAESSRIRRGRHDSQQRPAGDPDDDIEFCGRPICATTLRELPAVAAQLGGSPAAWSISEVGDGNLNLVFIVKGTKGGIAVKQALPYVRLVGESWPLPLSRSHYEYLALTHQARLAPGLVPAVLHHDEALALIAMELLEPHIIMRKGLIAGTTLSALRRRHHDLSGADAVLHVRPRAVRPRRRRRASPRSPATMRCARSPRI